ncbi:MAG TPA: hypothetical protein VNE58_14845 [Casimicrobiaceae bacterium]|nr:hypothetical protein [Casimicrobiaceae bacterium]
MIDYGNVLHCRGTNVIVGKAQLPLSSERETALYNYWVLFSAKRETALYNYWGLVL